MIEKNLIKQLVLESAIKLYAFGSSNTEIEIEKLNEFFNILNINIDNYSEKIEKIFLLLFDHIKQHQSEASIERIINLFSFCANNNLKEEELAFQAKKIETYAKFLMVYGVQLDNPDLYLSDKIEMMTDIDYNYLNEYGQARKMYLYSLLNLLISIPELDNDLIDETTKELEKYLD